MIDEINFDYSKLYDYLMYLLQTPGPTQACVKISKDDPRIEGNFPMENAIEKIIMELNKEQKVKLQIIRHNGNLLIVGGMKKHSKIRNDLLPQEINDIKKIPIIFGAHLDEICYMVTNKPGFLEGENLIVLPICAPPKDTHYSPIVSSDNKLQAVELVNPACKVVGFRNGKFEENIADGKIYKVDKIKEIKGKIPLKGNKQKEAIAKMPEAEDYFLMKVENNNSEIQPGDIVIQNYGDWTTSYKYTTTKQTIFSKAIDDRAGCIAVIYTVKELSKKGFCSKAILTSAEEGVPEDTSWGRLVRPSYKKFCNNKVVTLVCDGIDGWRLQEFKKGKKPVSPAIVIPYTAAGKGGGDIGIFSRFRDQIIPGLNILYHEKIAVTSTDYSSRSFEVKIMDDWTMMGFVQWSCGPPKLRSSVCHNNETVSLYQIINIIRTLCYSFEFFKNLRKLN